MKFKLFFILLLLIFGSFAAYYFLQNKKTTSVKKTLKSQTNDIQFENPKKSAHFESNTPAHGSTLAGVPINVVINFNFDLASPSEIKVYSIGVKNPQTGTTSPIDITSGKTIIDSNKLTMRRAIDAEAPDDIYQVDYKACWPDGSCHDGNFQFAIDRAKASDYEDLIGKSEVEVSLKDIKFNPKNIRISKGTKVTWVNDDYLDHYVNTDSHPAHTYYPPQNSNVLKRGDTYSVVFNESGVYPYHCSAHAGAMAGSILVE